MIPFYSLIKSIKCSNFPKKKTKFVSCFKCNIWNIQIHLLNTTVQLLTLEKQTDGQGRMVVHLQTFALDIGQAVLKVL